MENYIKRNVVRVHKKTLTAFFWLFIHLSVLFLPLSCFYFAYLSLSLADLLSPTFCLSLTLCDLFSLPESFQYLFPSHLTISMHSRHSLSPSSYLSLSTLLSISHIAQIVTIFNGI